MWPSLISKAKQGGVHAIDTYVFWNLHEPQPGKYEFSGRNDIVRFIKEVQSQGLYVCLRIGPFIEAEWSYGGLPFWLHDVPDIVFRSDNEPFKIENEYQNVERGFGDKGPPYVRWAAAMAVGLQTGVPWFMCKQDDAPDPVINACNGLKCGETFVGPNSPNKPAIWTENWTHYYDVYGNAPRIRSAENIAYHVALFIVKMNGSYINYYMFHGGTNFGSNGSAFELTSYYDPAPLDEYGLIRQPKWGHLKELHAAVSSNESTRTRTPVVKLDSKEIWEELHESIAVFDKTSLKSNILLEQMNTTKDTSDYLWYTSSYEQSEEQSTTIRVNSLGHVLRIFVNGKFIGAYMERRASGLENVRIGDKDLWNLSWGYQSKFDAPKGNDPVALNLGTMGKGQVWINGESIGRYWISFLNPQGSPSQIWYHIPRSFLKPRDNLLVMFDEEGGNPLGISVDTFQHEPVKQTITMSRSAASTCKQQTPIFALFSNANAVSL
ncbi:hypothetical protein SASPL_104178 [Salvia splendens]|uniref:beta-galactosidase n=1 Tax=Salvia splendens TaxID=180675 RepID=A0A8X9A888_SALSN|nr:hypothetical protein SASPL_104178 [Salvia splendens]